ncbi:MAG: SusD/RagB family nutrient-binding outer membrane lipoprotein [Bacteroidota bacterium]
MKKLTNILATGLVVVTTGCASYLEDLSVDPNRPGSVSLESHLTGTLVNNSVFHEGHMARIGAVWAQYFTASDRGAIGLDAYIISPEQYDRSWLNVYVLGLNQHRLLQAQAMEEGNDDIYHISRIVEGHMMGTVASLWGDIPYAQAADPDNHETPEFDDQLAVYATVDALLADAAASIGTGDGGLAADIYFEGNRDAWVAVANTLRARFALHQGDYAGALAALADGGISTPDHSLFTPHGNVLRGNSNQFYVFVEIERSGYLTANNANATAILLGDPTDATDDDPRLHMFYQSDDWTSSFEWEFNTSPTGFFAMDQDYPLVTYEEALLIEAEANARLNNQGAAQAALQAFYNHIDDQGLYGIDLDGGAAVDSYPNDVTGLTGTALIDAIMTERYLSLVGQMEGWMDVRRSAITGDGIQLTPKGNAATIPMRYLYPQIELDANDNVPEGRGLFYRDAIFQ